MKENELITVKKLKNGVISLNFSDEAFKEGIWNQQTTTARGLFFSEKLQKVVARSYDKFFNLGELVGEEKQSLDVVARKLSYPVDVWHKYNGYLGILGTNEVVLDNVLYSGVFYGVSGFSNFTSVYPNLKVTVDKPHVTWVYFGGSNTEGANSLNDAYVDSSNPNEYRSATFSKLYVSKDGNLVAAGVDAKFLPGYAPKYPHVTLHATGRYKPVDSAKLLSGEVECDVYEVKPFVLVGRVAHYTKEKRLVPALPRTRLFAASKTTDRHKFANNFKKILKTRLRRKPGGLTYLKNYLKDNDLSAVFEVLDVQNDPHIIKYNQSDVVLLDLIKNTTSFKKPENSESALRNLSLQLGLKAKERVAQLGDPKELQQFVLNATGVNYKLEVRDEESGKTSLEPVEGFVFEGQNHFMFKIKTNYYNFWKKIRGAFESVEKAKGKPGYVRPVEGTTEYNKLLQRFLGEVELLNFVLDNNVSGLDVVQLRTQFMQKYPDFTISTVVFDSDESTGRSGLSDGEPVASQDSGKPAQFSESDKQYGEVQSAWEKVSERAKSGTLKLFVGKKPRTNFNVVLERNKKGQYSVEEALSSIKNKLDLRKKVALVLIGPPGSGKSTFISKLSELTDSVSVHSTDDKFMKSGTYVFDENKLHKYHSETQREAGENMESGVELVVLDNTNLKQNDFSNESPNPDPKEYKFNNYAKKHGYVLHFVAFLTSPSTVYGPEGVNSAERVKKGKVFNNTSGKPKVYRMLQNYYSGGLSSLVGYTAKYE